MEYTELIWDRYLDSFDSELTELWDLMGSSLPTAHVEAIAYKRPCPGHRRQKLVDRSRSLLYTPRYTPDIPCIPFPSPGPRENRSVFITR